MSDDPDALLTPWIGSAFRHINATRSRDVLEFTYAGLYGQNRWNVPGERTLYLAGDLGVAIAEWGRRFPLSFPGEAMGPVRRSVYRLQLRIEQVLDLRDRAATDSLAIPDAPDSFGDVELARSIAHRVRTTTHAQAMLVPSIAFLDDLSRWNLVLFLQKLPVSTDSWITGVETIGPLTLGPD